ncbi:TPA: GIY-YIG nuclease family protein [Morganella morganii]|nr:GIY-YIG nuclease family protein [Morganella morganii]
MTTASDKNMWFLYIIRTESGYLYTGITRDVAQRVATHQSGKGAKYLRGKTGLHVVYQAALADRSIASKEEYRVKQLTKKKKERLVSDQPSDLTTYLNGGDYSQLSK